MLVCLLLKLLVFFGGGLFVCLLVCLFTCLFVFLFTCLLAFSIACFFVCLFSSGSYECLLYLSWLSLIPSRPLTFLCSLQSNRRSELECPPLLLAHATLLCSNHVVCRNQTSGASLYTQDHSDYEGDHRVTSAQCGRQWSNARNSDSISRTCKFGF